MILEAAVVVALCVGVTVCVIRLIVAILGDP